MRLASLLALALLIAGCSAVHVQEAPGEAPTIGHLSAQLPDDELRLVTSAEVHLSKALAADRKQMRRAAAHHYLEAARFSYAALSFAASEEHRTQVREFYSFATERLTSLL